MKLDKNRSGGRWLGYSVHFSSLVEFPRKSKIDLEKRTIHNASHDLRRQHTSLLISSIWGRQQVSEKKMWGWKHLGAIKLSSPTLNCKHWHYGSFKRSGNYDFKEKTIPLELWFRLWCNFYYWTFFATKCVTMAFILFCLLLPCPFPNLVNFHKERIMILDENERYGNSISSSQ